MVSKVKIMDPEAEVLGIERKGSRFVVEPVPEPAKVDFACGEMDPERDCNHFLFNDYFKDDAEDFSPYDLLMRMQFPMKKSRTRPRLEKFRVYWENYSFYAIWRKKFIKDHCCDEQDIWKEFFIASVPHLIINLFLIFYVVSGAFLFQGIDENIRQEKIYNVIQFTFTTIATVGYGNIVPTTEASKIFCIFYTLVGVPLLFLSLTNIGQFFAEGYWIFLASLNRSQELDAADDRRLPLPVVVTLLLLHSIIGGLLFHFWIDQMPVIPAIYFSFVSITTIGYGDITPTPNGGFQTFIIISYLAVGMVIMSTFVAALYNHLRKLHYLGRNFSGAAHVEVWFGGTRISVSELLHIVAEQFRVSPKILYDVLRDLDAIISTATDPNRETNIEEGGAGGLVRTSRKDLPGGVKRGSRSSKRDVASGVRERKSRIKKIEMKSELKPSETHILVKADSDLSINKLPESERENVMQALGMLHYITKTKSNIRERRASSASCKLHACRSRSQTVL